MADDVCDANRPIGIPKLHDEDGVYSPKTPGPGWFPVVDGDGKPLKPLVKCKCGRVSGIELHHVHADGRVTASYFDSTETSFVHKGKTYSHEPGCGWHVYIRLLDYDLGEFPPRD